MDKIKMVVCIDCGSEFEIVKVQDGIINIKRECDCDKDDVCVTLSESVETVYHC